MKEVTGMKKNDTTILKVMSSHVQFTTWTHPVVCVLSEAMVRLESMRREHRGAEQLHEQRC